MIVLVCQQCMREQDIPEWFPFYPDDKSRHAFCSEKCREIWMDRMKPEWLDNYYPGGNDESLR